VWSAQSIANVTRNKQEENEEAETKRTPVPLSSVQIQIRRGSPEGTRMTMAKKID